MVQHGKSCRSPEGRDKGGHRESTKGSRSQKRPEGKDTGKGEAFSRLDVKVEERWICSLGWP